jgi:HPt (histidine-containing phosphotransfer) domain-containing protein
MGEAEIYKALFGEFMDDVETKMPQLVLAYKQGDHATLGRLAHYIKGAALNLGAEPLGGFARDIELKAKAQDLENIEELLERIEVEIPRLREFMLLKMP